MSKIERGVLVGRDVHYRKTPNRGGQLAPSLIVLHDTAGTSYQGAVSWLVDPRARASAHIVISRKGEVTQLCSFLETTWHAGKSSYRGRPRVNDFSIGIELDNPGKMQPSGRNKARHWAGKLYKISSYGIEEKTTEFHGHGLWMPYTEAQLNALFAVVIALMGEYEIEDITTHWNISPGRKVDTNPLFPLSHFKAKASGREEDDMTALILPGATLRKWPSFYDSNVVLEVGEELEVTVEREGVFATEPRSPGSPPSHPWAYISDTEGLEGWVLKSEMEM